MFTDHMKSNSFESSFLQSQQTGRDDRKKIRFMLSQTPKRFLSSISQIELLLLGGTLWLCIGMIYYFLMGNPHRETEEFDFTLISGKLSFLFVLILTILGILSYCSTHSFYRKLWLLGSMLLWLILILTQVSFNPYSFTTGFFSIMCGIAFASFRRILVEDKINHASV